MSRWKICSMCEGEGKYVNPSIDAGGLSAEDFAEDPDFMEDYFSGVFDVRCSECRGSGKILIKDEEAFYERAAQEADERELAMMESGNFESGIRDYRFTS